MVAQVEHILDRKVEAGKYLYLVKWMGYGPGHNSWEPATMFSGAHAHAPHPLCDEKSARPGCCCAGSSSQCIAALCCFRSAPIYAELHPFASILASHLAQLSLSRPRRPRPSPFFLRPAWRARWLLLLPAADIAATIRDNWKGAGARPKAPFDKAPKK